MSASQMAIALPAAGAVVTATAATIHHAMFQHTTKRLRVQQTSNLLYFSTVLTWPFLFFLICRWMQIDVRENLHLLIGLAWPMALLLVRLFAVDPTTHTKVTVQEDHSNHQETRNTGSLMFSAAFGVGILLGAIKGTQDKDGSKLILVSLMICAAFFIPTHIFQIGTEQSLVVHAVQTCVMHVAIGILLMGISHSYFQNS